MVERVVLHIGAPKSGTTYLQSILWGNRAQLREGGVLLPGEHKREHDLLAAWTRDVRGFTELRDRLLTEVRDWPGQVVLSSEWFGMAEDDQAAKLVRELQAPRVDVVFTARAFVSIAPAAWQQTLKAGKATTWPEFLAGMDDGDPHWSWTTLDPAQVLPRWAPTVPVDRIHVVTVPPHGAPREELWRRFATACGLAHLDPDMGRTRANASLSAEAARLLQLVGPELRDAVGADEDENEARRWIRRQLSEGVLLPLGGRPIGISDHDVEVLQQHARRTARSLEEAGFDVVGDLADLTDPSRPAHGIPPEDVRTEELLPVVLGAVPELLARIRKQHQRANRAERSLRREFPDAAPEVVSTPASTTRARTFGDRGEPAAPDRRWGATMAGARRVLHPVKRRVQRRLRLLTRADRRRR